MLSEARLKFLKKMIILGPKTAILGPQFCRILVLGLIFGGRGARAPQGPLDPPLRQIDTDGQVIKLFTNKYRTPWLLPSDAHCCGKQIARFGPYKHRKSSYLYYWIVTKVIVNVVNVISKHKNNILPICVHGLKRFFPYWIKLKSRWRV